MRQVNDNIIPAQAAASINSDAIPAMNLFSCSVQLVTTGSAAGTMKLQASNDTPVASDAVPTHWADITGATVTASGAGTYMILKTDLCYEYVRVVYTNSGTGTISATFKGLGA